MFAVVNDSVVSVVCTEVGMNIEEFNTLIEDVHQKMREDAQKEALR